MAHRFPAVAKILTDQLVVRLLEENRNLKLELFWKKYDYAELCEVMKSANQKYKGPDCKCLTCDFIGRMTMMDNNNNETTPAQGHNCLFKIYFEGLIADCGMTHCIDNINNDDLLTTMMMSGDGGVVTSDIDTHFVDTSEHCDWENFVFGAKIWKARSVEDPELRKLVLLFHKLEEDFEAMELSPGNHVE
jgi:hypothetical protein